MNSYAVVFAALILAVHGGSLRSARQGWGAPPPSPSIEVVLEADAAASGFGESLLAGADASQALAADAVGTPQNPAEIALVGGTAVDLEQDVDVNQIAVGNLPNLSSSSINNAAAANLGLATDSLLGTISGGQSASLINTGSDFVLGGGQSGVNTSSSNTVIS